MIRRSIAKKALKAGATQTEDTRDAPPTIGAIVAVMAGIAAAWIAAGSTGMLAHPLRHGMVWVALAVAVIAAWPERGRGRANLLALVVGLAAAVVLLIPNGPVPNIAAVATVLAALAWCHSNSNRTAFLIAALAAGLLVVWRFASLTIPTVWLAADWLGGALGRLAGVIAQRPLAVGATFAGMDFLVVMGALVAGWTMATGRPRWPRAVCAGAAVLVGHLAYLTLLARSPDLAAALPIALPRAPDPYVPELYVPPPWLWSDAIRSLLPWNLPVLAAAIQLAIAAVMFRVGRWPADGNEQVVSPKTNSGEPVPLSQAAVVWGPIVLAALLPVVTVLGPAKSDLSDRKIVALDDGRLNWDKPVHDRFGRDAAGLYGMLPVFVESLGGQFVRAAELNDEALADADVLLVIHPLGQWPAERLERIWDFVRRGGSLLVVGEPAVLESGKPSNFEDVLEPTHIAVAFQTATPIAERWEQCLDLPAHPAVTGMGDERGVFGVGESASLEVAWPARPLLIGRWGFSDPGNDAYLTGTVQYDAGERLGDIVLAAEEPIGQGRVVVLADAGGLKNEGLPYNYELAGRLFGYLAHRPASPQAGWRQVFGLVACVLLIGLLWKRPHPVKCAGTAAVLGLSVLTWTAITSAESRVLPDGRSSSPNNLACIDSSHLNDFSLDLWRDRGVAGLTLTLARNGYLPILVSDWSGEQLDRAGMLVSIAPSRPFSAAECEQVYDFMKRGGAFICIAGAEHASAVQPLLSRVHIDVPPIRRQPGDASGDPIPGGCSWARYSPKDGVEAQAVLFASWPIEFDSADGHVVLHDTYSRPAAVWTSVEQGALVLIADSAFALNRNLEPARGVQPSEDEEADMETEGVPHNAYFWRWLTASLRGRADGLPPPPTPPSSDIDDEKAESGRAQKARDGRGMQPRRTPDEKEKR